MIAIAPAKNILHNPSPNDNAGKEVIAHQIVHHKIIQIIYIHFLKRIICHNKTTEAKISPIKKAHTKEGYISSKYVTKLANVPIATIIPKNNADKKFP